MKRLTVALPPAVFDELCRLAAQERRSPRDQAAVLVELSLSRAGLLPTVGGDV